MNERVVALLAAAIHRSSFASNVGAREAAEQVITEAEVFFQWLNEHPIGRQL